MLLPDVNVLVAAFREDADAHDAVHAWLDGARASRTPVLIATPVATGFVRVSTHPRIFRTPASHQLVWEWLDALMVGSGCRVVGPGPRHLEIVERVCRAADARGNLVTDVVIAALAIEHGAEVVSFDRDFARFEGLRWSTPIE